MWRSFFFAVGITLIFFGLQCLVVEEFRVDKNSRIFAVAEKANRALDSSSSRDFGRQNEINPLNNPTANIANQQRFSLPSSESYYGGPSRFQTPSYPNSQFAYGGRSQFAQQPLPVNQVSNSVQAGIGSNVVGPRIKALRSYPVKDWMPWGFLAAGTIISLYTKSTGHSRYSGE